METKTSLPAHRSVIISYSWRWLQPDGSYRWELVIGEQRNYGKCATADEADNMIEGVKRVFTKPRDDEQKEGEAR